MCHVWSAARKQHRRGCCRLTKPPRAGFLFVPRAVAGGVARHDVEAVMAVVHPDIKASFGGDEGIDAFRRLWRPSRAGQRALVASSPRCSRSAAPSRAGRRSWRRTPSADGRTASIRSSTWSLIAADVRIREAPRADAAVVTTLSFAILPVEPNGRARWTRSSGPRYSWTPGASDYVASRLRAKPDRLPRDVYAPPGPLAAWRCSSRETSPLEA